mmetsp:Transcript_70539/g.168989  ORF Transcript_70539/g.168989 Transcript_70539/m.168989 type:complete len:422 (+) Transcript_70539:2-1267(+)
MIRDRQLSGCSGLLLVRLALGFVCATLAVLVAASYGFVSYAAEEAIAGFLMINDAHVHEGCNFRDMFNMTRAMWLPGCGAIGFRTPAAILRCSGDCYSRSFLLEIEDFNRRHPGELVQYSSRHRSGHADVMLVGWLAPAPANATEAPIIVLQHGFAENSNMHRQIIATYLLRKLGFTVLVNNLRDHCYSQNTSEHVYQWGDAYPYDVLGAWDYAHHDPDGKLGGPRPKELIGLMGFSMGGFSSLNAMGLEEEVQAAWVDSPVHTVEGTMHHFLKMGLEEMGLPNFVAAPVATVFTPQIWRRLQAAAEEHDVDLARHEPEKVLPLGPPTRRPLKWVGNRYDTTIVPAAGRRLLKFLENYRDLYNVSAYEFESICNGENHCANHIHQPELYSRMMCEFWSSAMTLQPDFCITKFNSTPLLIQA